MSLMANYCLTSGCILLVQPQCPLCGSTQLNVTISTEGAFKLQNTTDTVTTSDGTKKTEVKEFARATLPNGTTVNNFETTFLQPVAHGRPLRPLRADASGSGDTSGGDSSGGGGSGDGSGSGGDSGGSSGGGSGDGSGSGSGGTSTTTEDTAPHLKGYIASSLGTSAVTCADCTAIFLLHASVVLTATGRKPPKKNDTKKDDTKTDDKKTGDTSTGTGTTAGYYGRSK